MMDGREGGWLLQLWEGQTGLKSARQAVRKGWQNLQVQDESAVQGRISSYPPRSLNVNTPAREYFAPEGSMFTDFPE